MCSLASLGVIASYQKTTSRGSKGRWNSLPVIFRAYPIQPSESVTSTRLPVNEKSLGSRDVVRRSLKLSKTS